MTINTPEEAGFIQQAAHLLDAGLLVAFPTETVYGIGCKVDRQALRRLNEVKDRQLGKHYTLHVGSREQLAKYVPFMNARAAKLVQNALPGPVTVVFELDDRALKQLKRDLPKGVFELLYPDGTVGVRYPANPIACAILSQAQSPIIATSANPSAQAPALNAKEILKDFDGRIDCLVDSPDFGCDYNKSSTVVKVGKRGIQILREGTISEEQIQKWTTVCILFVCTGNTCRSPMAEAFCRKYFSDNLDCQVDELEHFGYIIGSAGVAAYEGAPASRHAIEVCRAQQIDLSCHQSRQLTLQEIEQSDIIFTMSRNHRDRVVQLLPAASEKCFMLDEKSDIMDPIGFGHEVYRDCFREISDNVIKKTRDIL